jgi:hypothetical protein
MRRKNFINQFILALVTVCALAVSVCSGRAADVFKSAAGGFSVTLPSVPVESNESTDTDAGKIQMHMFVVDQTNKAIVLIYCDYDAKDVAKTSIKALLDGARDGGVKNSGGGKLTKETDITLDGNPGRELTIEAKVTSGIRVFRIQFFMVKNRLYQIILVGDDSTADAEKAKTIFKSFKLTGK